MYRNIRMRLGFFACVIFICAISVSGAYYLGKLYLGIIREGAVPKSTRVSSGSYQSTAAPEELKLLSLDPIPVYYLQAGVFSDMEGARVAAEPLEELGYIPYITRSAPYRLWIGVYQKRGDADLVKVQLRDKGIGSFTGSVVINGSNLRYSKGNEAFIKETAPVLETYTTWLKANLALFSADNAGRLDWIEIEKQGSVIDEVYNDIVNTKKDTESNSEELNRMFGAIEDTVGRYKEQLNVFKKQHNTRNFAVLQCRLLEFIDNYQLLRREIDNINKT